VQLDPAFLQAHVALPALRQRWLKRSTISPEAEAAIDWPSLGRAMRKLPPKLQHWITKYSIGMCGVGKFLRIWDDEIHSGCPLCGEHEDHLHAPWCPHPKAKRHWDHCIHHFSAWMDTQETAPVIKQAILTLSTQQNEFYRLMVLTLERGSKSTCDTTWTKKIARTSSTMG